MSAGSPAAAPVSVEETEVFTPRFGENGLLPCVAVDARSGQTLMLAWMNEEALRRTLETGFAHYWSRSRHALWKKGETSGALQRVLAVRTDCDQDSMLLLVECERAEDTCHTGRTTCFYRSVPLGPGDLARKLSFSAES